MLRIKYCIIVVFFFCVCSASLDDMRNCIEVGGALWFPNQLQPDPYGVLPVLSGLLLLTNVWVGFLSLLICTPVLRIQDRSAIFIIYAQIERVKGNNINTCLWFDGNVEYFVISIVGVMEALSKTTNFLRNFGFSSVLGLLP